MWYFGCESKDNKGHFIFNEAMKSYNLSPLIAALPGKLDGVFCPDNRQLQGEAKLGFVAGFTVLAFWDRSADKRFGSNSAFLKSGKHDFETVLGEAKEKFPQIFERFDFEIVEYKEK